MIYNYLKIIFSTFLFVFWCFSLTCQNIPENVAGIPVNYDESKAGSYSLPDVLIFPDGKEVNSTRQWNKKRRPQVVSLFEEFQFGKAPEAPDKLAFNVFDEGTLALDGKAIRKQITVYLTNDTSDHKMDILIYIPADAKKPVPLFFNLSFSPNATVADDPGIKADKMWGRAGERIPVDRGRSFGRLDINRFLSQGIGFATVYYGDIEPDFPEGIKYGIRGHYLKDGQDYPAPNEWGAISAWAWGLSRAMDYFEKDAQIDDEKVAVFGISRLGKTVLWAGALDLRFGMVIASCSGEGGAAISRRLYGETINHMTHPTRFFYQFAGNWRNFKDDPSTSPVDAHMLVSLIAPRPLLLQTGDTDKWSDPKGEFLAAVAAEPVYNLFGKKGLETEEMPEAGVPVLNDLGYFMHSGGHGALPGDYDIFIQFMKKHF